MGLPSLLLATTAWADHGGPLRTEEMSPLMIGLLVLALVAGVLIVVIVMLLTRRAG